MKGGRLKHWQQFRYNYDYNEINISHIQSIVKKNNVFFVLFYDYDYYIT